MEWEASVEEALKALSRGSPVLIFDSMGREAEVDMVYYAGGVDADTIYNLRVLAGGLICYATKLEVVRALGLPYGDELLERLGGGLELLARRRLGYGDRPAFTIWVNHTSVSTGIRDVDRARTVSELHRVTELVLAGKVGDAKRKFYTEFQAPGHVPVLAARSLVERRGHTELAVHLAEMAGLKPSVVFAEMLSRGGALGLEEAKVLSERMGWPLVTGNEVVEAYRRWRAV